VFFLNPTNSKILSCYFKRYLKVRHAHPGRQDKKEISYFTSVCTIAGTTAKIARTESFA